MTLSDTLTKLDEAATPGPWVERYGSWVETQDAILGCNKDGSMSVRHSGVLPIFRDFTGRKKRLREDIALIVALRNNLPRIIAELRWAERARVGLEKWADPTPNI